MQAFYSLGKKAMFKVTWPTRFVELTRTHMSSHFPPCVCEATKWSAEMYTGQSVEDLMISALGAWVDIDKAIIKQPLGGGIELQIKNADLKPEVPPVHCHGPQSRLEVRKVRLKVRHRSV